MIRVAFQELLLFLLPFAAFAFGLVLLRREVLHPESWSGRTAWLALAGLMVAIGGFLAEGVFADHHTGAYVPPHMENGRPVPGSFR